MHARSMFGSENSSQWTEAFLIDDAVLLFPKKSILQFAQREYVLFEFAYLPITMQSYISQVL